MTPQQEQSFTAFVAESGDALARYARLLFPDRHEAEDALQTALLRVARNWRDGLDAPAACTRTALRHLAVDGARRRHLVAVPSDGQPVTAVGPDLAEAHAAREHLDAVLSALPARQRLTVVLRVIDDLSEAETAAVMGCSTGTVKSNLSRGLATLRGRVSRDPTSRGPDDDHHRPADVPRAAAARRFSGSRGTRPCRPRPSRARPGGGAGTS